MTSSPTGTGSARRAELLTELVAINSVNPLQAGPRSGDGGEQALAVELAQRAESLGATTHLDEVEAGRPNVYARFPGSTDRTICIDVHLDTVGVEHVTGDPFASRVEDGRVYGRGSVDTKATFAVILELMESAARGDVELGPTVALVGTVGEEAGGLIGAYRFNDWMKSEDLTFDGVVVAEPTECAPVHGHKGGLGMEITVQGRAAHSSKPHLGANAIFGAARVVAAMEAENERLAEAGGTTAMGPGTVSVTEIDGGLARNIIPDACRLYAGRRTAPGEDPYESYRHLHRLATEAAHPLPVEIELVNGRASGAFYLDPDTAIVKELAGLAGSEPEVVTYGTNALAYDRVEEIVVFGPGSIDQAHQAVEWVEVAELDRAAEVYRRWLTVAG